MSDAQNQFTSPAARWVKFPWLSIIFIIFGGVVFLFALDENFLSRFDYHAFGKLFDLASILLFGWMVILIIGWAVHRGKFDPFEPPIWFSANVLGQVILNVWLLQRDRLPYIPWVRINREWLMPETVLLFAIGLTALWVGYTWTFRRFRLCTKSTKPIGSVRLSNVILIWLVGAFIKYISILIGTSSYLGTGGGRIWTNYFFFIDLTYIAATIILVITHFRSPTLISWGWMALFLSLELISAMVAGTKTFALTLVLLAMCIYYAIGRLSLKLLSWLAVGMLIIFTLVPVVNSYRQLLLALDYDNGVEISNRMEALKVALVQTLDKPLSNLMGDTGETFKYRQGSLFDTTASVLFLHPNQIGFIGLDMAEYTIQQLIPRVLWPGKPSERPSLYLITTVYADVSSEHGYSDIGLFADSYRTGGWIFVIFYFLALGAFTAWLYVRGPGSENLAGTIFYLVFITSIVRYDSTISNILIYSAQFGLLLWGIIVIGMFRRNQRTYQNMHETQSQANRG